MLVSVACGTADLRPDGFTADQPPLPLADEARTLLQRAANAAGLSAWQQKRTSGVIMRDEWALPLATSLGLAPWDGQLLRFRYANGTFDGQFTWLDGDRRDDVAGLQAGATYAGRVGDAPSFENDDNIRFFVGAFVYLNELPFRLLDAPVVAQLEDASFAGRPQHRVFATWGRAAPQADVDQYIVWLDAQTLEVTLVEYTLRDQGAFFTGVAHYDQYKTVDGVRVPFRTSVTLSPSEDFAEDYLHQVVFESFAFDAFDQATLYPDASRGSLGAGVKSASP